MALKLTNFRPPSPLRSALIKNPPDAIPHTEDLEALQEELQRMRKLSMDRSKKASQDIKLIQDSYRRIREKEKGKAKAPEPVKRERDCT
jgi:transcriptional adapter 3